MRVGIDPAPRFRSWMLERSRAGRQGGVAVESTGDDDARYLGGRACAARREYRLVPLVSAVFAPCVDGEGAPLGRGARTPGVPGGRSRRRIALDNLARALPDVAGRERERIARGAFEHFGRVLLELIRFGTLSRDEILALADVEGEEHVRQAYAAGKG